MRKPRIPQADFTTGPVLKNMLRFFIPIMLGTLLQLLYSTVDAIILGRFVGKTALAAVGGSDMVLINLIVGFFVGLSSGASVVISQHYGAGEQALVSKSVHTAIALSLAIGALTTALGVLVTPLFLSALDTPKDVMAYSRDYLVWYFAGMIPSMVYNMGSGILRAVGDSKSPLLFLAVCAAANTVLDLLFVAVFRMEVAGAAIATSLSQFLCAALVVRTLARQTNSCRLSLHKLGFDPGLLKRMLYIGLPAGLASTMYSVTNLFVQKAINLLGTDTVAAWSAFWKLDGIFWPVSGAIGIAVMTFAGQNYGARKPERIKMSIRAGLKIYLSFAAVYTLALFFLREPAIRLFCSDPGVVAQGVRIVEYIAFFYPVFACVEIFSSAMRGVGNAITPTVLTFLGVCALRLILLFSVTFPHLSNFTIALCYPATWTAASVLFLLYYRFGRWMPKPSEPEQTL
jgi:putative MATE family efflux protein